MDIDNRFVGAKGVGPGRGKEWSFYINFHYVEWIKQQGSTV